MSGKEHEVGLSTTCWLIAGGKPETVWTSEMTGPIGSPSPPTLRSLRRGWIARKRADRQSKSHSTK